MKKNRKRYVSLLLCISMAAISAFPSSAAEKLRAPSWVKWGSIPGEITYEVIPEAEGEYRYYYYKDGEPYGAMTYINQKGVYNYYYDVTESGGYTFQVGAVGDGVDTLDSDLSVMSEVFAYEKPEIELGSPQNLQWSQTEKGLAMWDLPADSEKYKDIIRYRLKLYQEGPEGQRVLTVEGVDGTSYDLGRYMTKEIDYVFSVQALSKNINIISHGAEVFGSGEIEIPDENKGVLDKLEDINERYATSSDAVRELKNLDVKELAIAMQSNGDVLDMIKELEEKYLRDLGALVESTASDVNLNKDDIQLTGAGMNIASGSNAVRFEVKKPDQEAKVDLTLYKNTFQFDFSLDGVVDKLFVPVRITMPIPEGINSDRLVILHHHRDGSYEVVPLLKHGDGTVSFTVISFSIFTFAEEIINSEDPIKPDDPSKPDDPDQSVSSKRTGSGRAAVNKIQNTTGSWEHTESGWRFKKSDGTYPTQQWVMVNNKWYWFDQMGYMQSGWMLNQGNWYYLNPQQGEQEGAMMLGWQMIDGKWYYFNPISNGIQGAMYADTVTPDGYIVGRDGVWQE